MATDREWQPPHEWRPALESTVIDDRPESRGARGTVLNVEVGGPHFADRDFWVAVRWMDGTREDRIASHWLYGEVLCDYDGTGPGEMIARGTNPWVEVNGVPVNWMGCRSDLPNEECDTCTWSPVPGALEAMDTPEGVQCCGTCRVFDSDLAAALALARTVGGAVRYLCEVQA